MERGRRGAGRGGGCGGEAVTEGWRSQWGGGRIRAATVARRQPSTLLGEFNFFKKIINLDGPCNRMAPQKIFYAPSSLTFYPIYIYILF